MGIIVANETGRDSFHTLFQTDTSTPPSDRPFRQTTIQVGQVKVNVDVCRVVSDDTGLYAAYGTSERYIRGLRPDQEIALHSFLNTPGVDHRLDVACVRLGDSQTEDTPVIPIAFEVSLDGVPEQVYPHGFFTVKGDLRSAQAFEVAPVTPGTLTRYPLLKGEYNGKPLIRERR